MSRNRPVRPDQFPCESVALKPGNVEGDDHYPNVAIEGEAQEEAREEEPEEVKEVSAPRSRHCHL